MGDGVVLDPHIVGDFYPEWQAEEGQLYQMISQLSFSTGLAITQRLLDEWIIKCSTQDFVEWVTDMIKEGAIRYVDTELAQIPQGIRKRIHAEFGLPKNRSKNIECIKCANATRVRYIVSDDIYFYEPRCKKADAKMKRRVKDKRRGRLCLFLEKALSIIVGTPDHCCCHFDIE